MNTRFVLCLILTLAACSQTPSRPQRSCYHRSEAAEVEIGYCQAIRSGNRLYISGIAGRGEMAAAVQSVYERLRQTLEANGLTFRDVVKENVFTTDLDAFKNSGAVRQAFYADTLPAATWVQVQRLFDPSLVVEVELVAEFPR